MATFPFFFFFSSRRRHTRLTCDWSSDVCSSDLIALSPFREAGYRRLMEAHVVAGNRAEALRVYEQCRQLLAEELGAYPSPETDPIYRGRLDAPQTSVRRTAVAEQTVGSGVCAL